MMKQWKRLLSVLAAPVLALALFLPSLPAQAAVGDAAYIAAVNRAIEQSLTVNVVSLEESLTQYEMDASGNITSVVDGVRKITCAYDDRGTVTSIVFYEPTFDAAGNLIPGSYTEQSRTTSAPVYGKDGKLSAITGDSFGILDFTYDKAGRITSVKKGWSRDKMTVEYRFTYDAQGRLSDWKLLAAGAVINDEETIMFTDNGLPLAQIIRINDKDEDGNWLDPVVHQAVYRYGDNGALVEQALQYTECDYTMMTEYGY